MLAAFWRGLYTDNLALKDPRMPARKCTSCFLGDNNLWIRAELLHDVPSREKRLQKAGCLYVLSVDAQKVT